MIESYVKELEFTNENISKRLEESLHQNEKMAKFITCIRMAYSDLQGEVDDYAYWNKKAMLDVLMGYEKTDSTVTRIKTNHGGECAEEYSKTLEAFRNEYKSTFGSTIDDMVSVIDSEMTKFVNSK